MFLKLTLIYALFFFQWSTYCSPLDTFALESRGIKQPDASALQEFSTNGRCEPFSKEIVIAQQFSLWKTPALLFTNIVEGGLVIVTNGYNVWSGFSPDLDDQVSMSSLLTGNDGIEGNGKSLAQSIEDEEAMFFKQTSVLVLGHATTASLTQIGNAVREIVKSAASDATVTIKELVMTGEDYCEIRVLNLSEDLETKRQVQIFLGEYKDGTAPLMQQDFSYGTQGEEDEDSFQFPEAKWDL